jgi:hypothetical protein
MDAFEIKERQFATYIQANAPVEELATGFRWLDRAVWFGDANLPAVPGSTGPMKNRLFIRASHTLYAVFLNRRGVQWP